MWSTQRRQALLFHFHQNGTNIDGPFATEQLPPEKRNTIFAGHSSAAHAYWNELLKGNSHQKFSVANMIELLLKSILVYHSPMFEAWKVPKRPVEVLCDVTQHLLAYRAAVENRTNSSGMRTHTGQHSRLPCMHALNFS